MRKNKAWVTAHPFMSASCANPFQAFFFIYFLLSWLAHGDTIKMQAFVSSDLSFFPLSGQWQIDECNLSTSVQLSQGQRFVKAAFGQSPQTRGSIS